MGTLYHPPFPTFDGNKDLFMDLPHISRYASSADEGNIPNDMPPLDLTFSLDLSNEEDYDSSILGSRPTIPTLDQFLLTPHISRPIPASSKKISARPTRPIEIKLPEFQLKEIVYLPSAGARAHEFLSTLEGEDLKKRPMNWKILQCLVSGATVANCSLKVFSEADVEYHFRVFYAHIVAEYLNIMEGYGPKDPRRYYPRKGKVVSGSGLSHAYADVEIDRASVELKTYWSINEKFIPTLLDLPARILGNLVDPHPEAGFKFAFKYPTFLADTLGSATQPIVQIWSQLHEKQSFFAQGSSHEYSFFAIKDPETPQRLYISSCYLTTFSEQGPPEAIQDPAKSALYTMYNLFRIANKSEYADGFLKKLREDMEREGKLIPVHFRDIERAGEARPTKGTAGVNLSNGTVGVLYYDQPVNKQGVVRGNPPKNPYKDLSTSRIDESTLPTASDVPAVAVPERKIPSRIPTFSKRPLQEPGLPDDTPVEPPQTASGSESRPSRSTVQQPVKSGPHTRSKSRNATAARAPVGPAQGQSIAGQPTAREPQQGTRLPRPAAQTAQAVSSKPPGLKGKGKQGSS
ncbi:hypothetical protein C8R46DRAFT_1130914 [Mycena filopes]|nr:hypothetical protein C8R46DRAFT_1130914 [Mycena filopes]